MLRPPDSAKALFHLFSGQPLPPSPVRRFGQAYKGIFRRYEVLDLIEYVTACILREFVTRHRDVKLVIIDPIVSAVAGDIHKANDVRRALQQIVDFARSLALQYWGSLTFRKTHPAEAQPNVSLALKRSEQLPG